MNRTLAIVVAAAVTGAGLAACDNTDLLVGDDTSLSGPDASSPVDPSGPDSGRAADTGSDATEADADASPSGCAAPATCISSLQPCQTVVSGATCPASTPLCCARACPELIPPVPNFCDGGPVAPLYAGKCITGFACGPVDCATAGGQCVGLTPGACSGGTFGDATKYACGSGVGAGCCLP